MPIDMLGAALAMTGLLTTFVAFAVNVKHYIWLRHFFHKSMIWVYAMFAIWFGGYLMISQLNLPEYQYTVEFISTLTAFGAFSGFALLTSAVFLLKENANRDYVHLIFFGGGVLAAIHAQYDIFILEWTGTNWTWILRWELVLANILYFSLCWVTAAPILFRVYYKTRQTQRYTSRIRLLFFISMLTLIVGMITYLWHGINLPTIDPVHLLFNHRFSFVIYIAIYQATAAVLLYLHPTIFFASNPHIMGLYIIKTESHTPVYYYDFQMGIGRIGADLFSMALSGIKMVLAESLNSREELKGIHAGGNVILVGEGHSVIGVLVTKRSDPLLERLLNLTVKAFEIEYRERLKEVIRPKTFLPFDDVVEKNFEFALPIKQKPLIL